MTVKPSHYSLYPKVLKQPRPGLDLNWGPLESEATISPNLQRVLVKQ